MCNPREPLRSHNRTGQHQGNRRPAPTPLFRGRLPKLTESGDMVGGRAAESDNSEGHSSLLMGLVGFMVSVKKETEHRQWEYARPGSSQHSGCSARHLLPEMGTCRPPASSFRGALPFIHGISRPPNAHPIAHTTLLLIGIAPP